MSEPSDSPIPPLSAVETLRSAHRLDGFDCGTESLNLWLRRFALVNQRSDSSQTYVVHRNLSVVGYYSLAPGSARKEEAPVRIGKGLANHPIGVILLARLAVDRQERGTGLGKALLKDALLRIEAAAEIVSARAVLVHALDEQALTFYEHFGFEQSPVDRFRLFLLLKDLRASHRSSK